MWSEWIFGFQFLHETCKHDSYDRQIELLTDSKSVCYSFTEEESRELIAAKDVDGDGFVFESTD